MALGFVALIALVAAPTAHHLVIADRLVSPEPAVRQAPAAALAPPKPSPVLLVRGLGTEAQRFDRLYQAELLDLIEALGDAIPPEVLEELRRGLAEEAAARRDAVIAKALAKGSVLR